MVTGARTFSLEDTFLSPQILDPPPTRHALLAFLLALAAILHIGTAAWGDLYDGIEGEVAGGAREMLQTRQWLRPTNDGIPALRTPPFSYWVVALSCKIFGVTTTAARIPVALAMIGSVALTFLIGERLADYWRGFAAGLIHLCSIGGFLFGRIVSPGPFAALFVSGAIYCAVCGYQHRKFRRVWFGAFALSTALACLSTGLHAIFYPAGICVLLSILYREARMRFRPILHWSNLLLCIAVIVPWYLWAHLHFPAFLSQLIARPLAFGDRHLLGWAVAGCFPALFLILPALLVVPRKILRPDEFTAADALPLIWIAMTLIGIAFIGERDIGAAALVLPGFALFAASAWERISPGLRTFGIILVFVAGVVAWGLVGFAPGVLDQVANRQFPDWVWVSMQPLAHITLVALVIFSAAALVVVTKQRGEIVLLLALGAMVPVGFCLTEARSRVTSFYSLADAAQYLNPRIGAGGSVVFEGTPHEGSSLGLYLEKKFFLLNQQPSIFERDPESQAKYLDERLVLEAWERSSPIYLIIDERRVSYWRKSITERVHIFHQVSTCGSRIILSNQL
ncbi:MAG: ArnT family glycosyltransferase [Chthoniobacterales bacterium]